MDSIQGEKFRQFIEDSRPGVCRRIMQRFRLSEDDAKDIFQESAMALYNSISAGLDVSLDRFFSGIWYRQTLKHIRKHRRIVSCDMADPASEAVSLRRINQIIGTTAEARAAAQQSTPPDEAFDLKQMKERVAKALDGMARQCRQLLTKFYLEGYSWAELAQQFDLKNVNTAKAAANRCRRRFEEKYKELEVYVKQ